MLKKKLRRLSAILMAGVMTMSMMGTASATEGETTPSYTPTDSYVLNFDGTYDGPQWQYFSPYWPAGEYDGVYDDYIQSISFSLYNTRTEKPIATYCTDLDTGLHAGSEFRRLNLEDSTYAAAGAGLIRSIVLKGFPNVDVAELGAAAGVTDLTVGEAVAATQAAIWKAAHGSLLEFDDFCYYIDTAWSPDATEHYDECMVEINNGYAADANEDKIEAHIEKVYNYLLNLAPTAPKEMAVSNASFTSLSDPSLVKNADGTYNVSVTTSVDIAGDADLTLSAYMAADKTYFTSVNGIADGEYTLTINNVPAAIANGDVKLAIDGEQAVSDVFLFDAIGERGASQSLVGIDNSKLPVHAEVVAETERKITFKKFEKVVQGDKYIEGKPLEGIIFNVYKVCDLKYYLNGDTKLDAIPDDAAVAKYAKERYLAGNVITDENGIAEFSLTKQGLPDGVYLVVEEAHPAVEKPAAPFYVMVPFSYNGEGWDYTVEVTVKNQLRTEIDIDKDVIEVGKDESSISTSEAFPWIITASIPSDIAEAKSYTITDTLDSRLTFVEDSVEAYAITDAASVKLEAEDFTAAYDAETRVLTIALTAAGMDKAAGYNNIRVSFKTTADLEIGEVIENQANLDYTNSFGSSYEDTSDKPKVYTFGFNLIKVDGNTEKPLQDAEFTLYAPAADGAIDLTLENGSVVKVNKVTDLVSGENGTAAYSGLAEGTYYLVETKAPKTYNLLLHPVVVSVDETSHTAESAVKVLNFTGFALPETGGIGTTVYTLMGSLTMAASGMYIFRKKRED